MIRLSVKSLEPGMVLAAPIPHPSAPGRILLNAGFEFDADMIRKLGRFAVYTVWIQHPGLDFLDERVNDAVPQSRIVLYESVKNTFTGVANRTAGAFNVTEYRTVVGNMIFNMVANKRHAVWAERIMQGERELFGHSSNVAYLSLLIGMQLRRYLASERKYVTGSEAEDLTNLGLGAMFHDFGKLFAQEPEVQRRHLCDNKEDDAYREHPLRGYRSLQGRLEATAAAVVLHHHQRFDGKGFPVPKKRSREREQRRYEGHRIHIFARVVAVANMLDALINACQRRNRPTIAALTAIQRDQFAGMFDPVVLAAALRCIPPFSLAACVKLSDGRQAVVTDLTGEPCRPRVHVVPSLDSLSGDVGEELDLSLPGAPTIIHESGRDVTAYVEEFETLFARLQATPTHGGLAVETVAGKKPVALPNS